MELISSAMSKALSSVWSSKLNPSNLEDNACSNKVVPSKSLATSTRSIDSNQSDIKNRVASLRVQREKDFSIDSNELIEKDARRKYKESLEYEDTAAKNLEVPESAVNFFASSKDSNENVKVVSSGHQNRNNNLTKTLEVQLPSYRGNSHHLSAYSCNDVDLIENDHSLSNREGDSRKIQSRYDKSKTKDLLLGFNPMEEQAANLSMQSKTGSLMHQKSIERGRMGRRATQISLHGEYFYPDNRPVRSLSVSSNPVKGKYDIYKILLRAKPYYSTLCSTQKG